MDMNEKQIFFYRFQIVICIIHFIISFLVLIFLWINENARNDYRNKIMEIEGWLREAIEKEELTFDLSLIKKLMKSETAIYDLMYARYDEYVKNNSFIPKAEKERVKQSYIDVADRLKNICNSMFYKLQPYKFTLKQEKDGSICYAPDEVEEYINTIGIRTFSDKERKYVELLDKATKAIAECANFERENGINEYALRCFDIVPNTDGSLLTAYAKGLAHDARLGTVNVERIIKGLLNM